MRYPITVCNTPHIDLSLVWRRWAFHRVFRFNSGSPYVSWRIGPIFIRVFLHGGS